MTQYTDLCRRIINKGEWVENERTGVRCKAVINANMTYGAGSGLLPIDTTHKIFWKPAIAELLRYLKGFTSAAQFRELSCNTRNANANENEAWLNNPNRKGTDDMCRVYGAQLLWQGPAGKSVDQLKKVADNLSKRVFGVKESQEERFACTAVHVSVGELLNRIKDK
jgi:thymidylate synthase